MKQIILIRKDLKMRRGKEIAQGSHASMAFLLKGGCKMDEPTKKWIESGQTKICLKVDSEAELLDAYQKAIKAGLKAHLITDAGRTEFNGVPTRTAVAIGPNDAEAIDKITGNLSTY